MDVVLNSLYNISTNNSVKPSVKEVPVSQDDSLKTAEAEEQKKLEEEKRVDKSNSAEKLSQIGRAHV